MARVVLLLTVVVLATSLLLVQDVEAKKKKGAKWTGANVGKKAPKRRIATVVNELEKNVTALWEEVKTLGQPVHVHLHGDGHVMDSHDHHDHDEHHDDHGDTGHDHKDHCDDDHDHKDHDKDHDHKDHDKDHDHKDHDKDNDHKDHDKDHDHKDHDHKDHDKHHDHKEKRGRKGHDHHGKRSHYPKGKKHGPHHDHDDHRDMKMKMMKKPMKGGHSHPHHDHDHQNDDDVDMKAMKMKKLMKGGLSHDHGKDEDKDGKDCGEWKEKYTHDKRPGTHVHIHLHTGKEEHEEEEEEETEHQHPMPSLPEEYRYARCDVEGNSALPFLERQNIKGTMFFRQMPYQVLEVKGNLKGFEVSPDSKDEQENKHLRGIHGHQYGDMSNGCNSLGGHLNPSGVDHGGPDSEHRHVGDFGNIQVKKDGTAMLAFNDSYASLFDAGSLLGRSLVIHGGSDDQGHGHDAGSKKTGNAGVRIACCVIVACAEPSGTWST